MRRQDELVGKSLLHQLLYSDGSVRTILNFADLGLAEQLSAAFRNGFIALYGHTTVTSQRQSWGNVRKFAKFLCSTGMDARLPLPLDVLLQFHTWLTASGLTALNAQKILNASASLLAYCARNAPQLLPKGMLFKVERFEPCPINHRKTIPEDAVKNILRCCQKDIEGIESRVATWKRLSNCLVEVGKDGDEAKHSFLIRELLALGNGYLPDMKVILAAKRNLKKRVLEAGGIRQISRQMYLCIEDIFPFYLAILIQTSGNASSIREMPRDCIRPHPLRDDLERVVWQKPRAHKEQWVDMPIDRPWSAANLVRRLGVLNQCIIPKCTARDQDKLFVAFRLTRGPLALPSIAGLESLKVQFEKRHDLPHFTFSSIRRSGAKAHHRAAGSIHGAQARLNHVSIETTAHYVDVEEMADSHDRLINRYQGLLLEASISGARPAPTERRELDAIERHAETVFGFGCIDPFAGLAEGSVRGTLCMQFQKCATCPGAVIPLDDVLVVARLLSANLALKNARERAMQEGWMPRFMKLYEPTRQVLTNQILPAVTDAIRLRALEMVDNRRIPRLE